MSPGTLKRLKSFRIVSQVLFFALFLLIFIRSLDPFAALENPFLRFDPLIFLTNPEANLPVIAAVAGLLALAVLLGRVFCGWICPLGGLIEALDFLLSPLRRRNPWALSRFPGRRALARHPVSILLLAATLVAVFTPTPLLQFVHPNVWIIRIASLTSLGLVFLALLALLALFARRLWCTYLCPLGALYGLLARIPLFRLRIAACTACGRCDLCPTEAADYRTRKVLPHQCILCFDYEHSCPARLPGAGRVRAATAAAAAAPSGGGGGDAAKAGVAAAPTGFRFSLSQRRGRAARGGSSAGEQRPAERAALLYSRRSFLGLSFQLLGGLALGGILSGVSRFRGTGLLRPPGVVIEARFLENCLRCQQCVRSCPNGIIKIADQRHGLASLFTPHLRFGPYGCDYYCQVCQQVCPNRAIPLQRLEDKQKTPIGVARIDESACVVYKQGFNCLVCEEVCPVPGKAIRYEVKENPEDPAQALQEPKMIADRCIGCGICEARCPAEPVAIRVFAIPRG